MQPEGLVECNKYGGNHHPFSHVKANPFFETFSQQQTSSSNVPLMWTYRPRANLLGIAQPPRPQYDTWQHYSIKFLYPTPLTLVQSGRPSIGPRGASAPQNFSKKLWNFFLELSYHFSPLYKIIYIYIYIFYIRKSKNKHNFHLNRRIMLELQTILQKNYKRFM